MIQPPPAWLHSDHHDCATWTQPDRARSVPLISRTVICISHATGAGGTDLGHIVRSDWASVWSTRRSSRGRQRRNVSVEDLADVERRKSLLSRMLSEMAKGVAMGSPEGAISLYAGEPAPDDNSFAG